MEQLMWFMSGAGVVLVAVRLLDITPPGTGIAGSVIALLGLVPATLLARRTRARLVKLESDLNSLRSAPR